MPHSMIFDVELLPGGATVYVERGEPLLDAALRNGIDISHACGGNCSCTTCQVEVLSGAENLSPMELPEDERLEMSLTRTKLSRLGCQAPVSQGSVRVRIVGGEESWGN